MKLGHLKLGLTGGRRGTPPTPAAPSNTVAPVISGSNIVGGTLTTTNGSWSGYPSPTFTYQWRNAGSDIGGATNSTYVTQAGDEGDAIDCVVTATNTEGSASQDSNNITPGTVPVNTVAPVASGTSESGQTLSVTNGTWTGTATITYTYQWRRDGVNISSATNNTYLLTVTDENTDVDCVVTGTNSYGVDDADSNDIAVTAPAGNVRYWVGGSATWDATAGSKWATSSGGAGGASVPTSTDNVFFDGNSSGTCTLSASSVCNNLDCTGFTGTISHPTATDLNVYGNLKFVAGMTYTIGSVTSAINFNATTTGHTIDSGTKVLGNIFFLGVGGGQTLASALTATGATITVTRGSFDTGNFNINAGSFASSNSNVRSIALGSSTLTLTGTSPVIFTTATNLTFNAGTSTISTTDTNAITFASGSQTFYDYTAGSRGTTTTLTGDSTFRNFNIAGSAGSASELVLGGNLTITGTLTASGNSDVRRLFIRSSVMNTARTITAAAIAFSNVDLRDITGAGAASWNLSAITGLSGDGGGNSGITFTTPSTSYWIGGTGVWSANAEWSSTSGGSGGNHRVPLIQDTAIFDANSFSTTSLAVDMQGTQTIRFCNIDASAATNNPTFTRGGSSVEFYGGLLYPATCTVTNTATIYTFVGRGSHSIDLGGSPAAAPVTIDSVGGVYTWLRGYTGTSLTFNRGECDFNDFNFTWTNQISLMVGNTRVLRYGNGTITLSGTGTVINVSNTTGLTTYTEGSTIDVTNTSASTKTLTLGGQTYNALRIRGASGAGTVTISGSNTIGTLTFDPNANIRLAPSSTQILTALSAVGTSGNTITIQPTSGTATLSDSSGTNTLDYATITSMIFTGGATWQATNSTNGGGNSGISFI